MTYRLMELTMLKFYLYSLKILETQTPSDCWILTGISINASIEGQSVT